MRFLILQFDNWFDTCEVLEWLGHVSLKLVTWAWSHHSRLSHTEDLKNGTCGLFGLGIKVIHVFTIPRFVASSELLQQSFTGYAPTFWIKHRREIPVTDLVEKHLKWWKRFEDLQALTNRKNPPTKMTDCFIWYQGRKANIVWTLIAVEVQVQCSAMQNHIVRFNVCFVPLSFNK